MNPEMPMERPSAFLKEDLKKSPNDAEAWLRKAGALRSLNRLVVLVQLIEGKTFSEQGQPSRGDEDVQRVLGGI
jgi:hypothetical protein